jgi:hypothetical protein
MDHTWPYYDGNTHDHTWTIHGHIMTEIHTDHTWKYYDGHIFSKTKIQKIETNYTFPIH